MGLLRDEVKGWYANHGGSTAIQYIEDDSVKKVSYEQLVDAVFAMEKELRKDESRRIAIIGETSVHWIVYFFASLLAGKQTFICDMLLPEREMQEVLKLVDVQKVYLSAQLKGLDESLKAHDSELSTEFWKQNVIDPGDHTERYPNESKVDEEGKIVCLTSGTTSKAKGVVIGSRGFLVNNLHTARLLACEKGDAVYSPIPLYHVYGACVIFVFLHLGAKLCLGSMRSIEKDLELFSPSRLLSVPTIVEFLEKKNKLDQGIKSMIVAGCKCEKKIELICKEHGIILQNGYGSSESAGTVAVNAVGDSIDELSVVNTRDVRIAEDGEILVEAPYLMDGYYKNPEATKEKIDGNVLFTGDLGYLDEKGHLHINGRKTDMIAMANGDKIYCEETDEMLCALKGVREAAVIYAGQKLIAVICPEEGVSDEQIRESVAGYNKEQQVIRRMADIWIRQEALPRTSIGKMKRNELTKEYINRSEM